MSTKALVLEIVGIDRASATFEKIGAEVTATTTKMSTMQKAGAMAGKALAIGLAGVAAGAYEATKAAAEDQQVQALFANTVKNATGATNEQISSITEWVSKQGELYGVSKDDLEPALSKLAVATGSVTQAQKLASLAMDVSAGTGKNLNVVSASLAKAAQGNVGSLARLGVATKDAAGHTLTLSQITASLTQKYHGDAAKAADTMAGKQKILSVQFHELMVKIGAGLIPVMTQLAQVLLKVVGFISQHTKAVGIAAAAVGGFLLTVWAVSKAMAVWKTVTEAVTAVQGIYAVVTGEATAETVGQQIALKVAAVASKAFAAAQWLVNAALDANPIGLVVIAIAALVAGLILAYKHSETFRNIVNGAFHAVAATVATVVTFIKDHWKLLLAILVGPIGAAVILIASHWSAIKAGAHMLITWLGDAWQAVKQSITGPVKAAGDAVSSVWDDIKTGFASVRDKISGIADGLKSTLVAPFNLVKSAINDVISAVENLLGKIDSLISKIKSIPHPHIPGFGRVEGAAETGAGSVIPGISKVGRQAAGNGGGVTGAGRRAGAAEDGDLGTVVIVVRDEAAHEMQRKLLKLKRVNGGLALGLA